MQRTKLLFIFAVAAALMLAGPAPTDPAPTGGLPSTWKTQWISAPGAPPRGACVVHFRKTFSLAEVPKHFVIMVSGDNRYELYVNGVTVASGPAMGDIFHWRYATLDIASHLHSGENVLAAQIWNFGELAPVRQISNRTGFFLRGVTSSAVDTDASWKCRLDAGWTFLPVDRSKIDDYYAAGPAERLKAADYLWGWQKEGFDDSSWDSAVDLGSARPRGTIDTHSRWMLVPRNIPMMELKPQRLARVVRSEGVEVPADFVAGKSPVSIPPHSQAKILFDQGEETTGYPELEVSGGQGAKVTMIYAEALYRDDHKGNRNVTAGKHIRGVEDYFVPDGAAHRTFRPLQWRTWRYLQVEVTTGAEPLRLDDLRSEFTAYPFTLRATFESGDPVLQKIWQVGWRTARLCAHSTYMDCPYYERLQYVGDTRLQALISFYDAGDDRLAKNAIETINESRMPEGLTLSRYPSELAQVIPPFSLYWVSMMRDLWWYEGATNFLKPYLPGERGVLNWYERRLLPNGLLGRMDWWEFVDWTQGFRNGVPPQEANGQSAVLSLQLADALHNAADLEAALGSKTIAAHDRALAARIARAVYAHCWDQARGLLADTPARKHFSQHANILGVLTGAIPAAQQKAVVEKLLTDESLSQCSYYFRFYLFRAMSQVGLADEYLAQLGPWKGMLKLGLTTWAEKPEPTRSDCHAWSAHPNFDLLATVAGIEPAAPGFTRVTIAPHLGPLQHLRASMPSPQGEIAVSYRLTGGHLSAEITLPKGVTGSFVWQGRKEVLHGGQQQISM